MVCVSPHWNNQLELIAMAITELDGNIYRKHKSIWWQKTMVSGPDFPNQANPMIGQSAIHGPFSIVMLVYWKVNRLSIVHLPIHWKPPTTPGQTATLDWEPGPLVPSSPRPLVSSSPRPLVPSSPRPLVPSSPRPLVPSSPRPLHPWPRYQRAGPEAMGIINGGIYGWNAWYMVRDALGKSIHRDITGNTATNVMALLDGWLYDQVTACFHRETNENWNWSHPKTKTI